MIFVIGLPRSRTAWFSVWLDIPHELLDGCYSESDFIDRCKVGDSDSMLMWFPIRKHYPKAKVLVIHRDINEVINSLGRIFNLNDSLVDVLKQSNRRLSSIKNALHINFNEIDEKLPEIWRHLKGTRFDSERTERLKNMNIEIREIHGDHRTFLKFVRL